MGWKTEGPRLLQHVVPSNGLALLFRAPADFYRHHVKPLMAYLPASLGLHRYAKSQRAQLFGQTAGLPVFMALFTFAGLAVTSGRCFCLPAC